MSIKARKKRQNRARWRASDKGALRYEIRVARGRQPQQKVANSTVARSATPNLQYAKLLQI